MHAMFKWSAALALTLVCGVAYAANFGTVVQVHGEVADIALDERHGRVYAANLTAYRVEVMNTANNQLLAPIPVPHPPSAVAVSPDNRFLVIGEYQKVDRSAANPPFLPDGGGLTIWDLDANTSFHLDLVNPVLTITFGADGKALVVGRGASDASGQATLVPDVFLLDPVARNLQPIPAPTTYGQSIPVPLVTFPAQIIQAASGVSGDGQTIYVMAAVSADTSKTLQLVYRVSTQTLSAVVFTSTPPQGPRSVAVNADGSSYLLGWGLQALPAVGFPLVAQFPAPNGAFQLGSHAWDRNRNLILTNAPVDANDAVLSIVDTDNLTIRERIHISELLSGRSVMKNDSSVMYSASQSGVMVLPIGTLGQTPRIGTLQEDLLFLADSCNRVTLSQTLNIVSISSASADFTLSLPKGTQGVTLSRTSGTTPARVTVTIDPSAFQGASGTTSILLTITSNAAVNLPPAVRLLINTRDFNQHGMIVNIPGKLVDMLSDTARNRIYILRQDQNVVLVYDAITLQRIAALRTGNTPVQMAMTVDGKYLLVGNENAQIANVFDLDALSATNPIIFPGGHYPRAFGVSTTGIFTLIRPAGNPPPGQTGVPPGLLDHVNFDARTADTPATLNGGVNPSIYQNKLPTDDGALVSTPAHDYLMLALADGTVAEYDTTAQAWTVSRKDLTSLSGAYGAFNSKLFLAGNNLLDGGLVATGTPFPTTDGIPSGVAQLSATGIRTTTGTANAPGTIQRIDLTNFNEYNPTLLAEAPLTPDMLKTAQVGQIGQSILSFTRTLAVSGNQQTIYALTVSGLTVLSANFDAPVAKPFIQSVGNTADGNAGVAPGGQITIGGTGFTPQFVWASGTPLPVLLGDMCVIVNNGAIPLIHVSPSQVGAQLPFSALGTATMVIKGPGGISDPFTFNVSANAPAIYSDGSGSPLILRDDNYQLVDFTNPVHPNQNISIYLTGLGAVSPTVDAGQPGPLNPFALAQTQPTVTLGSVGTTVTYAGLVPGLIGVYQINVTMPKGVPPGSSVPLTVSQGKAATTVRVRVVTP